MDLIEKLSDVEGIIIYEDADSGLSTETSSGMEELLRRSIKDSPEAIESDVIMSGS